TFQSLRLPSAFSRNAPLRVPTRTRTLLISTSCWLQFPDLHVRGDRRPDRNREMPQCDSFRFYLQTASFFSMHRCRGRFWEFVLAFFDAERAGSAGLVEMPLMTFSA